jgi:tryptophan synthase beta chain
MGKADDYPDIVVGCFGGGSNFAGLSFPFIRENITGGKKSRMIAVEPASCPKLTRGKFMYDFGDSVGMTPLLHMYTLGHNFMPAKIHAGGLRYHGAGVLVSQLLNDGFIEAQSKFQNNCFSNGVLFARAEGIIPAPESTYAITGAIDEAKKADEEGVSKSILFNLSGHGHFDLASYDKYFAGELDDHELTDADIQASLAKI